MSETYDVVVTGGSSPLGDHVLPALVATGAKVAATARSRCAANRIARARCDIVNFDLEEDSHLNAVKSDIVLHLAGIRFAAGARRLASDLGASKIIAISSASATAPGHPLREQLLTWEHEASESDAALSILRPTMIYGSARDSNVQRLYRLTQKLKIVPRVTGGGLVMPVLVDDVVSAIIETMTIREPIVRPVAGPVAIRLGDLVDSICTATGTPRIAATVPLKPFIQVAHLYRATNSGIHAIQMLRVDRVVPPPPEVGFAYTPTPLQEGVELAISRYS